MDTNVSSPEEQAIYEASVASMMVGLLFAAFFGGLATLQTALYFASNSKDHWLHRISIIFLCVLDISQLAFIFHATYYYAITKGVGFAFPAPLIWSFKIQIFMQTIIMSATKVLYTVRIWNLQKDGKKWIPIVLSVLLVIEYGLGTFFAIEATLVSGLRDLRRWHVKYSVFLAMSSNTLTDFLVAAALIYTIAKSRPSLGWTSSNCTMLVAYAMNTGTITGIASVLVLIAFIVGGFAEPLYIVSEMVLPQLYVNCYLSMVNASFYFQTKSSLDIAISYRSGRLDSDSNPHVLNLSRMGNHNDPERLMHHRSSSGSLVSEGEFGDDFSNLKLLKSPGTINEIGLPLFERNDDKVPEVRRKKPPVQVQVETTKTEYSIDRRMLHDTRFQTARVETGNFSPTS